MEKVKHRVGFGKLTTHCKTWRGWHYGMGCMAASGVGELVFIDGTMDRFVQQNLKKSATKLGLADDLYFQQDNDPKHTAERVRLWIVYNTPNTLKTPPQSTDLNPIRTSMG